MLPKFEAPPLRAWYGALHDINALDAIGWAFGLEGKDGLLSPASFYINEESETPSR